MVDKLGRRLKIGDIVAASSPYDSNMFIAEITGFTSKTVQFRDIATNSSKYGSIYSIQSLDDLKKGNYTKQRWISWSQIPHKRLLILKRKNV